MLPGFESPPFDALRFHLLHVCPAAVLHAGPDGLPRHRFERRTRANLLNIGRPRQKPLPPPRPNVPPIERWPARTCSGPPFSESISDTTPYRFITIDRNLGQEGAIDTVWRETELMDDSLSAISFRHIDVAGQVYLMRAAETR